MRRAARGWLPALALLLLPSCNADAPAPELAWRTAAGQAMSDLRAAPAHDETCRQVLRLSSDGSRVRLRLSNALSPTPLRLAAVTVGLRAAGSAARPGSLRTVTAGGRPAFVVPPGQVLTTDPVGVSVAEGEDLLVSLAVTGTAELTEHPYAAATGWCSGPATGDHTRDESGDAFAAGTREGLVVEDVAVEVPQDHPRSVVAIGDSLTDDPVAAVDTHLHWTAVLAQRLPDQPVANAAIAGNRVLLEGGLGRPLVERFDRDALARPGVGTVVLLAGTNDLARELPAPRLVQALGDLRDRARARGLRVVLATVPPATDRPPAAQAARRELNAWIRSASRADVVVDADSVLRDPGDLERLRPAYDHGDGLHLSSAGHRALGEAVAAALAG